MLTRSCRLVISKPYAAGSGACVGTGVGAGVGAFVAVGFLVGVFVGAGVAAEGLAVAVFEALDVAVGEAVCFWLLGDEDEAGRTVCVTCTGELEGSGVFSFFLQEASRRTDINRVNTIARPTLLNLWIMRLYSFPSLAYYAVLCNCRCLSIAFLFILIISFALPFCKLEYQLRISLYILKSLS